MVVFVSAYATTRRIFLHQFLCLLTIHQFLWRCDAAFLSRIHLTKLSPFPSQALPSFRTMKISRHQLSSFQNVAHNGHAVFNTDSDLMFATNTVGPCSTLVASEDIPAASIIQSFSHLLDATLHQPFLWSSLVMLTIVSLLYFWESSVEYLRENTPFALRPVIESMLGEIGGIGFIGLLLQIALGTRVGNWIGEMSEHYLGDEEILLESFEFLHSAFFQVAVGFFAVSSLMIATGLTKLEYIKKVTGLAVDPKADDKYTCVDSNLSPHYMQLIEAARSAKDVGDSRSQQNLFLKELFTSNDDLTLEFLLIRQSFLERFKYEESFRLDFEFLFGQYLKEIVELSPLVWIPLIPALAVGNAVDLSHDVVNSGSANAIASSGFFLSEPFVFLPNLLWQLLSLGICCLTFWKMAYIKSAMLPNTGQCGTLPGENVDAFDSSPAFIGPIEDLLGGEPAKSCHDRLFGSAGAAGKDMYLSLIKYHAWLTVSSIVFFASQIVPRDLVAIRVPNFEGVGDPNYVMAELIVFSAFVLAGLLQLVFLVPRTFVNYCLVNYGEDEYTVEKRMAAKSSEG